MGPVIGLPWSNRRISRTLSLSILVLFAALLAGPGAAAAAPHTLATTTPVATTVTAPSTVPAATTGGLPHAAAPAGAAALQQEFRSDPHPSWLPARSADHVAPTLTALEAQAQVNDAARGLAVGDGPAHGVALACTSVGASADQCRSSQPAVAAETWQNASGDDNYFGLPPEGYFGSMAYDAYDGYVLYFGGQDYAAGTDNQTWAYEDGLWFQLAPSPSYTFSPPAETLAAMAYDQDYQVVLLYGGCTYDVCPDNYTYYWTDSQGWTNLTASLFLPSPALASEAMTYAADAQDNYTVMYGGCTTEFCAPISNMTFGFAGFSWIQIPTPVTPEPLADTSLAYDPQPGESVMFGGCSLYSCDYNTTWLYYNFTWFNYSGLAALFGPTPPGRGYSVMSWDELDGEIVLFGGFADSGILGDTWTFTCPFFCQWNNVTPSNQAIPALGGAVMPGVSNASMGTMLFGGNFEVDGSSYLSNGTYFFEPQFSVAPAVPTNVVARTTVDVAANPSGGAGAYYPDEYYAEWWYGSNYSYGVNTSLNFTWPGTYTVNLESGDYFGVFDEVQFTVVATGPTTAISGNTTTDVGTPLALLGAAATGGSAPYNYTWSFGDSTFGYGLSVTHSWAGTGSYPVVLEVTDSENLTYNATVTIVVSASPAVTVAAAHATIDVGQADTFTPTLTGGAIPISYAWSFGDGTAVSTATAPTHTFATAGTYQVVLNVTDSVGGFATNSVSVTVNPALSGTASASASSVTTGTSITFTATASGGTTPYTYAWVFGDKATGTGASAPHTYATAGSYTAEVWINDSVGGSTTHTVAVTVTANSGGTGPGGNKNTSGTTGLSGTTLYVIVAVIVVVVAIAAALLMMRGRKPKTETPMPPPGGASGTPTPPPPGAQAPWAESPPPPGAGGSA